MQVGQFPASAANSLIEGYCDDFVSLAAILAQTLEQVSMRNINIDGSKQRLAMIETGMVELASAIRDLLDRPGGAAPTREAPTMAGSMPSGLQGAMDFGASDGQPTPAPAAPVPAAPTSAPAASPAAAARPALRDPRQQRAARPERRAPAASSATVQDDGGGGMRGTNRSMPILTVFQFVERTRKSGEMRVESGDELLRFEFNRGCVQSCISNKSARGERIGDLIVELGICNAATLNEVMRELGRCTMTQLGAALIERNLATEGQMQDALERQVRLRFSRVCKDPEASYEFVEGRPGQTDGRIRIAPMELAHQPRG